MDFFKDIIEPITRAHCRIMGYTKAAATQDSRSETLDTRDGISPGISPPAPAAAPIDPESPLYARLKKCRWVQDEDGGAYDSDCGHRWDFIEAGPIDNGMRFCCYCGKSLVDVPYVEDDDTDDERPADNHQMSEDQRLDSPQHGQADEINRQR